MVISLLNTFYRTVLIIYDKITLVGFNWNLIKNYMRVYPNRRFTIWIVILESSTNLDYIIDRG